MTDSFHNPYQAFDPAVDRPAVAAPGPESDVRCVLIYASYHHRILAVRGSLNVVIEWNAMGLKEFISIDGQQIASRAKFLLQDLWEFELQAGSTTHQVVMELNLVWRSILKGTRLRIDGEIVYEDGEWPV